MVFATFFDTANVRFESTAATFSSLKKTKTAFTITVYQQRQVYELKPTKQQGDSFYRFPWLPPRIDRIISFSPKFSIRKKCPEMVWLKTSFSLIKACHVWVQAVIKKNKLCTDFSSSTFVHTDKYN